MFGIGLPELAVLSLVAVMVFGPDRLPELAKQAGGMLRKLKRLADLTREDLRTQLGPEYADLELRDLDPRSVVRRHVAEALQDDPAAASAAVAQDAAGDLDVDQVASGPLPEPEDDGADVWHDERWDTEQWGDPEPAAREDDRAVS